jgi:hypothetical protein
LSKSLIKLRQFLLPLRPENIESIKVILLNIEESSEKLKISRVFAFEDKIVNERINHFV